MVTNASDLDAQTRSALATLATEVVHTGAYEDEDDHRSYGLLHPLAPQVQALVSELWQLQKAWLKSREPGVCHAACSMQLLSKAEGAAGEVGTSYRNDSVLRRAQPTDVSQVYVTDHCGERGTLTLHVPSLFRDAVGVVASGGMEYQLWANPSPVDLTTERNWRVWIRSWKHEYTAAKHAVGRDAS